MTWLRRRLPDLLELLALTGLAVAQPVLDVFGKSADTFVAHDAGTADIVAFAAAVTLLPALALWGVELAVAAASQRAARWLHLGLVALLVAVIVVEVGKRVTDVGYKRLSIGAVVLGLAAAALVAHVSFSRSWLRLLAAAPFAFAALFLFATPVADVASPPPRWPRT